MTDLPSPEAPFEQTHHPLFEVVRTRTGAVSIRNKLVNEVMHSPVGPWAEANALYIEQSDLKAKLSEPTENEFVIYDVGLGAAANALAALACMKSLGESARPMRLISFERDLELLRFALDHARYFDHFTGFTQVLEQLLATGEWSDRKITWELRHGCFLDLIGNETNKAHLVLYDPYSPNMNEEMWTTNCFKKLRAKCHDAEGGGAALFTYSIATRIRVSLIIAGFFVGHGRATGLKTETTQASTELGRLSAPLGQAWFDRWRRSHVRNSSECLPGEEAAENSIVEDYMSRILSGRAKD